MCISQGSEPVGENKSNFGSGGSLQLPRWKVGSRGGPPMRLIHAAFAGFEYLTLYGTPTVRSGKCDIR